MAIQGRRCRMTRSRRLGLDELMIVNPVRAGSGVCVLGDDGTLYRVQRLRPKRSTGLHAVRLRVEAGVARGHLFLGADGTVYEVIG